MGERPIRAMHGYHPGAKHSYAALLTNQPEIPDDIAAIPDIFHLMTRDAKLARSENRRPPARPEWLDLEFKHRESGIPGTVNAVAKLARS